MKDLILNKNELDVLFAKLHRAGSGGLFGKDYELDIVIRHHLEIEQIINKIIQKEFYDPEIIIGPNSGYGYAKKTYLLKAMGIFKKEPVLADKLLAINWIRNNFAHSTNYELSALDINKILGHSKSLRKYLKDNHKRLDHIPVLSLDGDNENKSIFQYSLEIGTIYSDNFKFLVFILIHALNQIYLPKKKAKKKLP